MVIRQPGRQAGWRLEFLTALPFRTSNLSVPLLSFLQNRPSISRRRSCGKVSARLPLLTAGACIGLILLPTSAVKAGDSIAAAANGSDPATPADSKASSFHRGGGLTMRLVSDVTAIQPGQTFHLGLWIQHEPGYHTYWSSQKCW